MSFIKSLKSYGNCASFVGGEDCIDSKYFIMLYSK